MNEGYRTLTAGEDLLPNRLVKIETGTTKVPPEVVYADSDERPHGSTLYAADDGDAVAIRLNNVSGTVLLEAGEAFAVAAALYTGADGKVVDTDPGTGTIRGVALEAATASGDVVECLMY